MTQPFLKLDMRNKNINDNDLSLNSTGDILLFQNRQGHCINNNRGHCHSLDSGDPLKGSDESENPKSTRVQDLGLYFFHKAEHLRHHENSSAILDFINMIVV